MIWTALDVVVVGVFAVQLIGWLCVVAAILRIKNGPVTHAIRRTVPLATTTKELVAASGVIAAQLKTRSLQLLRRSKNIQRRWTVGKLPMGMWIEPQHLRQAAGFFALLRQRKTTPNPVPRRRISLVQRLGLLPPVLSKLTPLGKVARIALQTLKQLRR
ncbi:hypothetical protein [Armatimonas sp.]|uniref:hypothetical protein n=1 Tax=Armatimonas sp. TaxID=1872638 RepID=UPI00374FFD00